MINLNPQHENEMLFELNVFAEVPYYGWPSESLYATVDALKDGMNRDGSIYKDYDSVTGAYRLTIKNEVENQKSIVSVTPKSQASWDKTTLMGALKEVNNLIGQAYRDDADTAKIVLKVQGEKELNALLIQFSQPENVKDLFLNAIGKIMVSSDGRELDNAHFRKKMEEMIKARTEFLNNNFSTIRDDTKKALNKTNALMKKMLRETQQFQLNADYNTTIDGRLEFSENTVRRKNPQLLKELNLLKEFRDSLKRAADEMSKIAKSRITEEDSKIIMRNVNDIREAFDNAKRATEALPPTDWKKEFKNILIIIGKFLGLVDENLSLYKADSHDHMVKLGSKLGIDKDTIGAIPKPGYKPEPLTLYRDSKQRESSRNRSDGLENENAFKPTTPATPGSHKKR